jgi:PAS domain S-box-containing protein
MLTAKVQRRIAPGAALFITYVAAATLGFRVAFVAEQVTTIWVPTGLAQTALLLWGRSLWPAVWLAAFTANALTGAPLWTAPVIATGNTLEAVAAAWILSRMRFDPAFSRMRDGVAFVVFASALSTAVSATIGVSSLCAASVQPWARFFQLWWTWWLGDAIGSLVVAVPLLTLMRTRQSPDARDRIESGALILGTILVTQLVFGGAVESVKGIHPLEYVIFPFLIMAAVRRGQPTTAVVVLAAAVVAIANTLRGSGPFASQDLQEGLILLQVFLGVLACTGIVLAAAIAERETSDGRRATAHAVGEVLAAAASLSDAAPGLVRAVCDRLDWAAGTIWVIDRAAAQMLVLHGYARSIAPDSRFMTETRQTRLAKGVGLPGRVWASGKAAWIEDVVNDPNFPRAAAARESGLHGAFAFPICIGDEVHAVAEFFHLSTAIPDAALLDTMSAVGNQVGQFVARKQSEASMAEAQRRTHAILETALDAIIGMDHRGIITEFNPAAERLFGYLAAEAVGRELAELLIPVGLRDHHRAGLARYLATGTGPFIDARVETTAHHADGRELPVEVAITRVPEDYPPRFTGFVRDLTARVRAERERDNLLERELAARREAESANRAKDEFLATLSHELRTPLNAIMGWSRMLIDGSLDGEQSRRRALEVIDRNAQLQATMVADILDVSRIITGGLRLDLRPVDLGSVIGAALDAVRPAAEAKKIRMHSALAGAARLTEGDPQRLQQIVWNLLANAVKFTAAGGQVDVGLQADDSTICITVRDDGMGIDPAFLPHVFDRFRQADGTVSRQHGGLGLGLAIVRHLVELHGGRVRAESEGQGHGATFIVELPRVDPAAERLSKPTSG